MIPHAQQQLAGPKKGGAKGGQGATIQPPGAGGKQDKAAGGKQGTAGATTSLPGGREIEPKLNTAPGSGLNTAAKSWTGSTTVSFLANLFGELRVEMKFVPTAFDR